MVSGAASAPICLPARIPRPDSDPRLARENDQDDRNTIDLSILSSLILLRMDQYKHLHT